MPSLYIIAGPNGAGKKTFIKRFAPRHLALLDFLNADELACDTWNVYFNADDAALVAHGTVDTLVVDDRTRFETLVREFNLKP